MDEIEFQHGVDGSTELMFYTIALEIVWCSKLAEVSRKRAMGRWRGSVGCASLDPSVVGRRGYEKQSPLCHRNLGEDFRNSDTSSGTYDIRWKRTKLAAQTLGNIDHRHTHGGLCATAHCREHNQQHGIGCRAQGEQGEHPTKQATPRSFKDQKSAAKAAAESAGKFEELTEVYAFHEIHLGGAVKGRLLTTGVPRGEADGQSPDPDDARFDKAEFLKRHNAAGLMADGFTVVALLPVAQLAKNGIGEGSSEEPRSEADRLQNFKRTWTELCAKEVIHEPIPDLDVPGKVEDFQRKVKSWAQMLRAGETLVVHCYSGRGRTGLVVGSLLKQLDPSGHQDWLEHILKVNPKYVETEEQWEFVEKNFPA